MSNEMEPIGQTVKGNNVLQLTYYAQWTALIGLYQWVKGIEANIFSCVFRITEKLLLAYLL